MKELLVTATPNQRRYIEAWIKHGSASKAARALGVGKAAVVSAVTRARNSAGKTTRKLEPDATAREYKARAAAAEARFEKLIATLGVAKKPPRVRIRKGKATKHTVHVIIPDSHGAHIDIAARDALVGDIRRLKPARITHLGDGLDCGGVFSAHQRSYTHEMTESFASDVSATNYFLDAVQEAADGCPFDYLEGNHEQRIERWAAQNFDSFDDARFILDRLGPCGVLAMRKRGIRYYRRSETYDGLSIPGTIKRGKCYFTHGFSHSRYADTTHLARVGANIVFGHVHRVMSVGERTVECDGMGAWCPGTIAKLQPLYRHTAPTSWQHGYAVQFVNESTGTFVHFNVPLHRGKSLLENVIDAIAPRAVKR